jgi:hypothetical protein
MILPLAVLATTALLFVAICPTKHSVPPSGRVPRSGSRALMRGVIRTICPTCCELVDDDGLSTLVTMMGETLVAGGPAAGDRVDVLADFTGSRYVAVSIVKTSAEY